ncbi:aspartate:alanine exchanger family transporter [Ornithinimicrobium cerasi]|uniref:Putative transport protein n=1 Tax=Ornithinimicrobium cerasi TaxID=2248773 RepID=A0A285VSN2_9MICO|nr:TrkA C-terminal domain-containing protein [Ornithinimicrobium cerasi]SOC56953.1 putative transport protein [Ornithinimicrobium cerasi]
MVDLLAGRPVLLLFAVLAVGTAVGAVRLRRVSLGPAAVLFTALAFSAADERLALPEVLGTFGLAVFAYAVGVTAGPSFFASLRTGLRPVSMVVAVLVGLGLVAWGIGRLLGLTPGHVAGLYAGALNNTPALAAAILRLDGSPDPTVAYSMSYVGGVVLLLAAATWALRSGDRHPTADDRSRPSPVRNATILVERDNALAVSELSWTPHGRVLFSRYQGEDGTTRIVQGDTVLRPGDQVLAIGPERALQHLTKQLGRRSGESMEAERTDLDYRRIVLSQRHFYGRTVADLDLFARFGARATRVRRADQDLLATDDFVLQAGDRVRVAAPREQMGLVAAYLGDSEHGTSDINPLGLALGLTAGLALGSVPMPVPGLGTLELGQAAGPLVVGLVLGRTGRTGRVVWTLPHQAAETLTQIGLLVFLAYAGGRAGSAFVEALGDPLGLQLVVAGLVVSGLHAAALLLLGRAWLRQAGPRLAGVVAGSQTQPAILAQAQERTGHDPRVALGYAMVYPVAMVVKILVAQVLTLV